VGLCAAHHSLTPPVLDDRLRGLNAIAVEPVERPGREVPVEAGARRGDLDLEAVENALGQAARVGVGLKHERRHGTDQDRLGHAILAMACDVADDLTATRRVPDVDGVVEVEMGDHGREVVCVMVHIVTVCDLCRARNPRSTKNIIWASQSSLDNGQPWLKAIGCPEPQSLKKISTPSFVVMVPMVR
jgi:hypothetical protein